MMRRVLPLFAVGLVVVACQETTTVPEFDHGTPVLSMADNAAFKYQDDLCQVGLPDGSAPLGRVASLTTNSNSGRINASCDLGILPNETGKAITYDDVQCIWFADPATLVSSVESHVVIRPDGRATAQCRFRQAVPNAFVLSDEVAAGALEGSFTFPLDGELSGDLVDLGAACDADPPLPDLTGKIGLIVRGGCPGFGLDVRFDQKILKAELAGAIAAIVYNSALGGDALLTMGGDPIVSIPGVFVAHSTGLALQSSTNVTIGPCAVNGKSLTCGGILKRRH